MQRTNLIIVIICAGLLIKCNVCSGASVISKPSLFVNPGCTISIPSNRRHAPSIIDQKSQIELLPIQNKLTGEWYVEVERGSRIKATCGRGNPLTNYDRWYYLLLTCVQETEFRDNNDELVLLPEGIECSNPRKPTPIITKNGTCSEIGSNFDVVFVTETPQRKFYTVCMDEATSGTLYSSSYIDGVSIADGLVEDSPNRPDFRGQEFYPFPIKQAYKWENAYEHLAELLGSEELVDRYFPQQHYRLSRGHLFPNADGIKAYEKHATFYYLNTVPQWQILNGGNWNILEQDVRYLAASLRRTLQVTTGAFGVTTLKDENNNEVEIWLARDYTGKLRLPVPRLVWKVIHDPVGNAAVAIVQVNNPWHQAGNQRSSTDIPCRDLCSSLRWLRSRDFHSARKGYTYCCDVQELRKVISYVPDLQYTELLGVGVSGNDDYDAEEDEGATDGSESSDVEEDEEEDTNGDSGSESESTSASSEEVIMGAEVRSNSTLLFNLDKVMNSLSIRDRNSSFPAYTKS